MKNLPTTVNKIAAHIRHEITNSNLKSSQHVKESEIAKKFNVSRVPVREAFRILQSEGYLNVIPNRGSFVKNISIEYIKETAIVYKLLAPVVLNAAIPNYKMLTFKKADMILNKVDVCRDFNQLGYLLWDFAKVIYGPSGMKFILNLFDEMYMHNIRSLNEIFEMRQDRHYDISNHKKFIELCKLSKKDEAIEIWNYHINQIEQFSLKLK